MDDAIEICSGCGKLPRSLDRLTGSFVCTRCGNNTTIEVSSDNYEKIVSDLDSNFHSRLLKKKLAAASSEPILIDVVRKKKANKQAPKKMVSKKKKAVSKKRKSAR
jgi:hypothetical protein